MSPVAANRHAGLAWLVLVLAGWLGAPVAQALAPAMAEDCDHCQVILAPDDCQVAATHLLAEPASSPARDRSDSPPLVAAAGLPATSVARGAGAWSIADPPLSPRSRHLIFSRFLE